MIVSQGIADLTQHDAGYTVAGSYDGLIDLPLGYPSGSMVTRLAKRLLQEVPAKGEWTVKVLGFITGACLHTQSQNLYIT
jgi:hypothetical protein